MKYDQRKIGTLLNLKILRNLIYERNNTNCAVHQAAGLTAFRLRLVSFPFALNRRTDSKECSCLRRNASFDFGNNAVSSDRKRRLSVDLRQPHDD